VRRSLGRITVAAAQAQRFEEDSLNFRAVLVMTRQLNNLSTLNSGNKPITAKMAAAMA
jgi:hypothetical protein